MKNAGLFVPFVIITASAAAVGARTSILGLNEYGPQVYMVGGLLFSALLSTATALGLMVQSHRIKKCLEQEIDKRKASEKNCYESDQLYSDFFNCAQAGVFVIDSKTHIVVDVNESALKMIGLEKEKVIGRNHNCFICLNSENPSSLADVAQRTSNIEMELLSSDGGKVAVLTRAIPIVLDNKQRVIISHIDVSQLKKTQADLEMALAVAKAANVTKDEFLANMSHEIRTPMNGIIGMSNIMLDTDLDNDQLEYMQIIQKSADSLLRIVNDVLDFSKIESGFFEMERHEFDLRATVENTVDALASTAHEKGLEFIFWIDPLVPVRLVGDEGRLKQVLLNLLSNALKFTHQGEVFLHVTVEKNEVFTTSLKFSVNDTGIGIPGDQTARIFKAFSQVDASTTRKYGGTGLGLAISKNIVEMMHGYITVQSEPGQGSIFVFTVQFQKPVSSAKKYSLPYRRFCDVAVADKRVLCVDDNKTNLFVLKGYLEYWGLKFSLAKSGPEALTLLRRAAREKDPYHLIIIDLIMPGMDGEALGRAIRNDDSIAAIQIVMLTSIGRGIDKERLDVIGVDDYLSKPIHQKKFHNCLLQVFSKENNGTSHAQIEHQGMMTRQMVNKSIVNNFRILVVEDNFINQQIVTKILSLHGYQSEVANNGRDAVRMLTARNFDLVLMDVQMPIMNGLEATDAIRNPAGSCRNQNVPIVALTANAMPEDRQMCLDAGMDGYLAKPVSPNMLISTIESFLSMADGDHDRICSMVK